MPIADQIYRQSEKNCKSVTAIAKRISFTRSCSVSFSPTWVYLEIIMCQCVSSSRFLGSQRETKKVYKLRVNSLPSPSLDSA